MSIPLKAGVRRKAALAAATAAVFVTLSSGDAVNAQSTSQYSMRFTPDRVAALVQAAGQKLDYLPGEVLVKFKAGMNAPDEQRALDGVRSRPLVGGLEWHGDVAILRDRTEPDATILAAELGAQPEVEYAQPNYLWHTNTTPNDPSFLSRQWNFQLIDMPEAWDINPGASNKVIVAVVDTGVTTVTQNFVLPTWNGTAIQNVTVRYATNPDLSASRLVKQMDFVFWDGPVVDMGGHGTHVSSTIGEDTNNNIAEAGIAYNVQIMPVKVCLSYWDVQFMMSNSGIGGFAPVDAGGCPTDAIADGIRYAADNGAQVLNLSLGGPGVTPTVQDALNYAVGKGVFIAIAGNDHDASKPVDPTEFPAAYAPGIDGVMSVGAVGPTSARSFYSNVGSYIEIAAPGGDSQIGGINGEVWQSTIFQSDSDPSTIVFPRFDRYAETPMQGTSMATPHVVGTAALIISQIMNQGVAHPDPAVVEALIKRTAKDLGAPGTDNEFGFGLIQPRLALRGFGIAR